MDGALYRPTVTAACGTATAVDDSLGYRVIKFVKECGFQRTVFRIGPKGLIRPVFY